MENLCFRTWHIWTQIPISRSIPVYDWHCILFCFNIFVDSLFVYINDWGISVISLVIKRSINTKQYHTASFIGNMLSFSPKAAVSSIPLAQVFWWLPSSPKVWWIFYYLCSQSILVPIFQSLQILGLWGGGEGVGISKISYPKLYHFSFVWGRSSKINEITQVIVFD